MAITDKASRLLADGNVHLLFVTDQLVRGRVRGDHGIYDVQWTGMNGWYCGCPCPSRCSHIEAVAEVTMRSVPAVTP